MLKEFIGKTALITGASSGIGKEFALQLHELGLNLILVARREELLSELNSKFNSARSGSSRYVTCDISNELNKLEEYSSQVDLIINNAGLGSFGYFETLDDTKLIDTNITATIKILKLFIPAMKERRFGGLISISSIAAFQPLPLMATYAATKSFNYVHTLGLRAELLAFGINSLVVCPGPTATEFGGVARVPGTLTGIARDSVTMVVKESLDAFEHKQPVIITGMRSKLSSLFSRLLPVKVTTYFVKRELQKALDKATL